MASPPRNPLQLDPAQVRTAADFHESYALFVRRNAEESGDSGAARIEAASAYRLAGQWRLLVDPEGAKDLLLEAASLLSDAGLMYGAFLQASLAPGAVSDRRREEWVNRLLRTDGGPLIDRESETAAGPPPDGMLDHVQQQAYLLLACAALTRPGSRDAADLWSFAAESPHRQGVVPTGSMAMPVRTFWGLAVDMLSPKEPQAVRSYAATLTELSRAYARTVDLAMANTLTWFNAAAPIDVADMDVIGTMAMGVRHFGPSLTRALRVEDATGLSAVARIPLNLGRRVASWDGPEGPGSIHLPDPPDPTDPPDGHGPVGPPGNPPPTFGGPGRPGGRGGLGGSGIGL
jgi:hypothetical protein